MEARKSTLADDPLYKIFEEHLHSGLYDDRPVEHFIRDVVEFYFKTLMVMGHVPHRLHEALRTDLGQDVAEMLRVKIYGHFGVGEYNRTRRGKKTP